MDLGLNDKVAMVTGVGSQIGYGKGIALVLAKEGCDLILCDIDIEGTKQTAVEVEALGRKAVSFRADVSSSAEITKIVNEALAKFGKIDILVNNAGASTPPKPFMEKTEDDWDRDININLRGVLICSRAVLSDMIPRKSGKIINISSNGAKTGGAGVAVYCAAKAGIVAFTKSLAAEMAPLGINVNCIAPGMGMTGFALQAPPDLIKMFLNTIPLKRPTTPQDIGNMVAYLASDVSSDIVGQTFSVDGGLTMY